MKTSSSTSATPAPSAAGPSASRGFDIDAIVGSISQDLFGVEEHARASLKRIDVYLRFPGLVREPLILNYWGPTGSGKTQLVKKIVHELGLEDRYHYMNLSNPSPSKWLKHMESIAEIAGAEVRDDLNDDDVDLDRLLAELDEANRYCDPSLAKEDGETFAYGADSLSEVSRRRRRGGRHAREKGGKRRNGLAGRQDGLDRIDAECGDDAAVTSQKPIVLFFDEFQHARVLDENRHESPKEEISDIWGILDGGVEFITGKPIQTIIFVAGNIDISSQEDVTKWTDKPEEQAYDGETPLSVIHEALSKRFRPEMLARLRNDHYVFQAMDQARALRIIQRELDLFASVLKERLAVRRITFRKGFAEFLLGFHGSMGMGARGIESLVNDKLKSHVGTWIAAAVDAGHQPTDIARLYISGHSESVAVRMAMADGSVIDHTYVIAPKKGRLVNPDSDETAIHAVHEAGHAIVGFIARRLPPIRVMIGLIRGDFRGFVELPNRNSFYSRMEMIHEIAISLGGHYAERLVFGDDHVTAGSSHDLAKAQRIAAAYVMEVGFGESMLVRTIENGFFEGKRPLMNADDRREMEQLIRAGEAVAKRVLSEQMPALLAMAKYLYLFGQMKSEEFSLLAGHYIDRQALAAFLSGAAGPGCEGSGRDGSGCEAAMEAPSLGENPSVRALEHLLDPAAGDLVGLLAGTIFSYTDRLFGEQASVARRHILYGQRKAEETDPTIRKALQSLCHDGLETPSVLLEDGAVDARKSVKASMDQERREAA